MAESPFLHAPLDPREKPILDDLLVTRDQLLLLKEDKSTHVKSADVLPLYEQVVEQVHVLNDVRADRHLELNRVDSVLDDCFQLISLFFLTIGRNNEAPAIYSMTATITRLLDHLKECAFFSTKDLESLGNTLQHMQETLDNGAGTYSPHLVERLHYRMEICHHLLQDCRDFLSTLSPQLTPIWEKLVSLLRSTAALNTKSKFSQKELDDLRGHLQEIKDTEIDGKIPASDGKIYEGQELVVPLLERCLMWCDLVQKK